jgi:hypothetical protein
LSKMTVIWLKFKSNHQQPESDVAFPYRLSENDNVSVLKAYAIKNGVDDTQMEPSYGRQKRNLYDV